MVTAIAGVVAIIVGVTTWLVAMLTIREKLRAPKPHPLEAGLANISLAIRDLGYPPIPRPLPPPPAPPPPRARP